MMIFRYTILYVEDVPSTLEFFERAFGLELLFIHESRDYGELSTGETKLAFSSMALMKQLGKNPISPNRNTPSFEIAFETDDVKSSLEAAVKAGATLVQDIQCKLTHIIAVKRYDA